MGQEQNFVIGVRTRIKFGILPAEILTGDLLAAPPDVLITAGAVANVGAGSITVAGLPGPVPAGTPIRFAPAVTITVTEPATEGATTLTVSALAAQVPVGSIIRFDHGRHLVKVAATAAQAATSITVEALTKSIADNAIGYYFTAAFAVAYTTKHAATGATTLFVEALAAQVANGAIALHQGLVELEGGTTSDEQIQAKDTETNVYGDELPYSTGMVTGASWQVSYSFNVLPADDGYFRMKYAAVNALRGIRAWVQKMDPVPEGYTQGESIQGLCDLTDWSTTNPADNIITGKVTFKGRGKPTVGHYA